MKCPLCRGSLRTISARDTEENGTRRRKECTICFSRMFTLEEILGGVDEYDDEKKKRTEAGKCFGCMYEDECTQSDRLEGKKIRFSCFIKNKRQ